MPSRTLIAVALGIPLLVGGTVLVVKASSSSDPEAPAAAAATAVEKKPATKVPPRAPSATLPAPKLPPLDPELKPPPVPAPPATVTPTEGEAPKAAEAKPGEADRALRRDIYRQHGRTVADFARSNPHVQDSATQAEVATKAEIIRKRTLMDKFACNAPESKERMELLSPEERAKWEQRCGKATPGAPPPARR